MRWFMSAQELRERLYDPATLPADCRGDLADLSLGMRQYLDNHVPGAVFIDGEDVMSGPKGKHGGRHPLPDLAQFAQAMGTNGLTPATVVVTYGFYAARLAILLELIGHPKAVILDGHLDEWLAAGCPVNRKLPNRQPSRVAVKENAALLVENAEVRRHVAARDALLIDVRAPERYRGEVEPLDPVAGHIPGAVNVPWERSFDAARRLLPPEKLRELYAPFLDGRPVIVYCGSGVTSCYTLLALREIGVGSRLYAGSWSDWVSYPGAPVATGAAS